MPKNWLGKVLWATAAVVEEILTQERAALDPYCRESDPSAHVARCADEVTAFDPRSGSKLADNAAKEHLLGTDRQFFCKTRITGTRASVHRERTGT